MSTIYILYKYVQYILLFFFIRDDQFRPPGQFIQRHSEIVCDLDERQDIGQSDSALIGGQGLSSDIELCGKHRLFYFLLFPQPFDVFTDHIFHIAAFRLPDTDFILPCNFPVDHRYPYYEYKDIYKYSAAVVLLPKQSRSVIRPSVLVQKMIS